MKEFDRLMADLLRLNVELQKRGVAFLLGGGMGLFLRATYHAASRQPRYPRALPIRPTKDLDIFLSGEIIASAGQMRELRDALSVLGYTPLEGAEHFQFEIRSSEGQQLSRIDLLAAPPKGNDRELVKIKRPRIRPIGIERIHARLTDEAFAIGEQSIAIVVDGNAVIHVPSSINYLVLKLHAYADRKTEQEKAATHALDIFRIAIDMTEEDWQTARDFMIAHEDSEHVRRAAAIRATEFHDVDADGVRALRSTAAFRAARDEFERYLVNVVGDLRDVFSP